MSDTTQTTKKKMSVSLYSKKTTISQSDYFKLVGLLAIARDHTKSLVVIQRAVEKILGEKHDDGHAGDVVYGNYSIDDLMKKTGLRVIKNAN